MNGANHQGASRYTSMTSGVGIASAGYGGSPMRWVSVLVALALTVFAVTAMFVSEGFALEGGQGQRGLRIVTVSKRVTRAQQSFVVSRSAKGQSCVLRLNRAGHVAARSRATRPGRGGEIEFVWSFPSTAPNGVWVAVVRCGSAGRSAVAKVDLYGSPLAAPAKLRHIVIHAVAVDPRRPPTLIEPPTGARGGGRYPPYGTIILPGSAWFGGHGVNVYSDGADGGSGHYQCVELFERFINTEGWYHGLAGAGIEGANQLFGAVPSSSFDKHPNGSGYIPVPGDAVIFSGERWGHVAIVNSVAAGHVELIEQNAAPSGRTTITITGSTLGNDGPYLSVIGVLHAKANSNPPGGSPAASENPPPQSSGLVFAAQNTDETPPDGVYFRNSPNTADTSRTPGLGVYMNEKVQLICYGWGDAVGPYNDKLWYDVSNATRPTANGVANEGWLNAHYIADGKSANELDAGVPVCPGHSATQESTPPPAESTPAPTPQPPAPTYSETTGGVAHTWTNYTNAGGTEGPSIPSNDTVQIACKVTGFRVEDGNTWWYRIASSPWSNNYYVSADAFYNNGQTSGSLKGTPFVDNNVPNC